MENRLISIYSLNPKERVLNLLYELDKNIFCPGGKKIWIPDLLSEKDISQLTGLTRQTVSKILKSLCRIEQDSICLKFKKNH
jgi:DNA-binding MarR family transcriptional regulator